MQKILLSLLLTGFLLFCFSQGQPAVDRAAQLKVYSIAAGIYQQAQGLADRAGDNESLLTKADELYQQSLVQFTQILPAIEKTGNDSLAFLVKLKTGFIHYYFEEPGDAKRDYLAVMALKKKLPAFPDSLLFIPCLYTGGIYYEQNQFDSALFYYKKAEQINDAHSKPLEEAQRLYNRLGAMSYETGNYRQARNYFEKALTLTKPGDNDLLTNYRINIASMLIKLEEYTSAKAIFEGLLPSPSFENEIFHNLGIISLKVKENKKAISYFRKVNYTDNKKKIDLLYNFGVAYAEQGMQDSSALYIEKALAENLRWNGQRKSIPHGLILKFQGEELLKHGSYQEAITRYQQAILQFHYPYNDTVIRANPEQFTGVYSFINLFNTLVAKAGAFEKWWQAEKDTQLLKVSLLTYQAAFKLASYVEKTYNSEEARLFLGKLKYTVHNEPISIALKLYELTGLRSYSEAAYFFDQQNKASALALTIRENELKDQTEGTNEWVKKEVLLKTAITRLSLKAAATTDSAGLEAINTAIRDREIELVTVAEKLDADPSWQQKKSLEQIPAVPTLQARLDDKTVLLSFHLSKNELVTFFISQKEFDYKKTATGSNFPEMVVEFKQALSNVSPDQRYAGEKAASFLYQQLIAPFRDKLDGKERMIIIPDDELNYLSFEALQDEHKQYLVENFSVQYQYSTALFGKNKKAITLSRNTLSFAPFASKGFSDTTGDFFTALPASRYEVAGLSGKSFMDEYASKENFLRYINHYSTVHLATHASVNNDDPSRSFIAFYPGKGEYKLYAPEIADLRLDSTRLVILSACETGTGQLIKGEGLMSLSRAFAFAGCPDIITSLWKAEDRTTAFLTQRLHYYLDKKYTIDKALQQARLDLLHDKDTDPRFQTPNYWAHLIFIGEYEHGQSSPGKKQLIMLAIGLLIAIAALFIAKSLFARNKQARFS